MRLIASILSVAALVLSSMPARAVSVLEALGMSASCAAGSRYMPGELGAAALTLQAEANRVIDAAVPGANYMAELQYFETLNTRAEYLVVCQMVESLRRAVESASRSCDELIAAYFKIYAVFEISLTARILSSDLKAELYRELEPAVDGCWERTTARCIDVKNRREVDRATMVVQVAVALGHPRLVLGSLQPPLRPCTQTVPKCLPTDEPQACRMYLDAVAGILFSPPLPPELVPLPPIPPQ